MNIHPTIETYPANGAPEEYPLTLAACKKGDANKWEIGDALLKECGPPGTGERNGAYGKIREVSKYLAANGLDYGLEHLRRLRRVSNAFQDGFRLPTAPWSVHDEARDAKTLSAVLKANPGVEITKDIVRSYRLNPVVKASNEKAARVAKANSVAKRTRHSDRNLHVLGRLGLTRADEISPCYVTTARTAIARVTQERHGKEAWSLILQAKDAGFITEANPCGGVLPTVRLLFPDAPLKWAQNYLLTEPKDRAYIRDELMPAAIVNKDAIIAEPERIEEILREHFAKVGHQKKLAEIERKIEVAKQYMNPLEKEVVLFGKTFWPLIDKPAYDYEQLTSAWFAFNAIWVAVRAGDGSPGAAAHAVRFTVQSLIRYSNSQEATPVRNNFRRLFDAMLAMADALEANPEGKFDPPMKPL